MKKEAGIGIAVLVVIVGGLFLGATRIHENREATMGNLTLRSTAFENGGTIPSRYTCDGDRAVNPPLEIRGVPEGTVSLALIMDDPDVPKALRPDGVFDHWVVFNIPPETTTIAEGEIPPGVSGANGAGQNAYTGPCPPPQYKPSEHRYFFKLYALDAMLELVPGATKAEVEAAMEGHIIEKTELVGVYRRVQ